MGAKEEAWQRGTYKCSECKYYSDSKLTPCMRCRHPLNMKDSNIGTVYMKSPDTRNWHNKCEFYKEKK